MVKNFKELQAKISPKRRKRIEKRVKHLIKAVEVRGAKPFIKIPGGKKRLLPQIREQLPESFNVYVEPMVGGGAVFFDLVDANPELKCYINDFNPDISNSYLAIEKNYKKVCSSLKEVVCHSDAWNSKFWYNSIRFHFNEEKASQYLRTAQFLYLNHLCFNGLIRYNKSGGFNAPFGRYKNPKILDKDDLEKVSLTLQRNCEERIYCQDFSNIVAKVLLEEDDLGSVFFYFDPPYDPVNTTSSFTSYTSQGFNKEDHFRLRLVADEITKRGGKFLLSESDTPFICELFKTYTIVKTKAPRSINCKGSKRGNVSELLIRNY